MIDYETYCKIKALQKQNLRSTQIAALVHKHVDTIRYWIKEDNYHQRKTIQRASILDPFKEKIKSWLEKYPYSSVQIYQNLLELNYEGGLTTVRNYVRKVRPPKQKGFLTLSFRPGECAQVDWGQYGTIPVGSTRRKLHFFVMVLCHSRMMYLEFTLLERMEHFLTCHENAFRFFGAVPESVMVDNLKSAVLTRLVGQDPVFNRRYLDFANHYGFIIRACNVGKGNEKGRVENAVGYVKKNFLGGLNIADFSSLQPAAQQWVDTTANVRIHATTQKKPIGLFDEEKNACRQLPHTPYDCGTIITARVTNQFRVVVDTNRYSVPAEYSKELVTIKLYPDRLCIYQDNKFVARHVRSYDRNQNFEHPDHPKELLQQRKRAREQTLYKRFLALSNKADDYYKQLQQRRMNPLHHIRKIVALSEQYGKDKVSLALEDAFTFQAFSCEYIANILEQRERKMPEPGPLHLTRRQDLLELDIETPDLSVYDKKGDEDEQKK